MSKCMYCGRALDTTGEDGVCLTCRYALPSTHTYAVPPLGWKCPICGKVNAPWVSECKCSSASPFIVTCNTEVNND
jgi:hypothetical protein